MMLIGADFVSPIKPQLNIPNWTVGVGCAYGQSADPLHREPDPVIRVQQEPFDVAAEVAALTAGRTDIGAIVTFTGTVRGDTKGPSGAGAGEGVGERKPIRSMTLEHYPGMTEAELARIEAEATARWPLQGTAIIHRVGELVPGDPIVLVIAASPHRQAAFDAAAFLMDYLKTRAPFWKKETGLDGIGQWVDARDTDDAALAKWQVPPLSHHAGR